jgi:hypothetical protein
MVLREYNNSIPITTTGIKHIVSKRSQAKYHTSSGITTTKEHGLTTSVLLIGRGPPRATPTSSTSSISFPTSISSFFGTELRYLAMQWLARKRRITLTAIAIGNFVVGTIHRDKPTPTMRATERCDARVMVMWQGGGWRTMKPRKSLKNTLILYTLPL